MDFLYKLFPYKSIVNFDNNTLTIWWVILTIFVFVVGVIHLWRMIRKIRNGVLASLQNFPKTDGINDSTLKSVWKDYELSFIQYNDKNKTDDSAIDYFNEKNLIKFS